jgi:hypothetical protein
MAQKVQVLFTDDLDGGDAEGTVSFGLEGTTYEIDLSGQNAAKLRKVLGPYLAAGRKAGGQARRRGRRPAVGGINPIEVRDWAKANNIDVNDRGRVPTSVIARYREATGEIGPVDTGTPSSSGIAAPNPPFANPSFMPYQALHSTAT